MNPAHVFGEPTFCSYGGLLWSLAVKHGVDIDFVERCAVELLEDNTLPPVGGLARLGWLSDFVGSRAEVERQKAQATYKGKKPKQKKNEFDKPEYTAVAEALGFTRLELVALVLLNDGGMSFYKIAQLIEQHPPVYSSAMTPRRRGEEYDFLIVCAQAAARRGDSCTEVSIRELARTTEPIITELFW